MRLESFDVQRFGCAAPYSHSAEFSETGLVRVRIVSMLYVEFQLNRCLSCELQNPNGFSYRTGNLSRIFSFPPFRNLFSYFLFMPFSYIFFWFPSGVSLISLRFLPGLLQTFQHVKELNASVTRSQLSNSNPGTGFFSPTSNWKAECRKKQLCPSEHNSVQVKPEYLEIPNFCKNWTHPRVL